MKQIKSDLSTQVIKDFRDAFEGPNSKVLLHICVFCMIMLVRWFDILIVLVVELVSMWSCHVMYCEGTIPLSLSRKVI